MRGGGMPGDVTVWMRGERETQEWPGRSAYNESSSRDNARRSGS
jgi:hypothetical protein